MKKQYITKKYLESINMSRKEYDIHRGVRHEDGLTHKEKIALNKHRKLLHKINEELIVDEKIVVTNDIDIVIAEDIMSDFITIAQIKKKYLINKTSYGNVVSDVCFVRKTNKLESISVIVKRSDPHTPIYLMSKDFKDGCYKSIFGDIATKLVPHLFVDDTIGYEDLEEV